MIGHRRDDACYVAVPEGSADRYPFFYKVRVVIHKICSIPASVVAPHNPDITADVQCQRAHIGAEVDSGGINARLH
ncbi:MAG: hypothetical protein OEV56_04870, partial [Dehalococcoidia bacterium]|nr:hypothetical protein [Dehalococcoidia bacterium]